MKLPFLASFLVLIIIVLYVTHKNSRAEEKVEKAFWDRENQANFIRKKSLDSLNYITIPDSLLLMKPALMTDTISTCLSALLELSAQKIVNLTGISNTDLKLTYGTANITILSQYDFHYTKLVQILQKLAAELSANGEEALAISVLEFAVDTGTDVSQSYYLLAELYKKQQTPEKIEFLIQRAQTLHSLLKNSIVRTLQASGQ